MEGITAILFDVIIQVWNWIKQNATLGVGSTVTGLATLILVLYYRRLFKQSAEQTEVLEASISPVIDADIVPRSHFFDVELTNRGEGTARNIQIHIEIFGGGKVFRYVGYLTPSLRPGNMLIYPEDRVADPLEYRNESVRVYPSFNVEPIYRADWLKETDEWETDDRVFKFYLWIQYYWKRYKEWRKPDSYQFKTIDDVMDRLNDSNILEAELNVYVTYTGISGEAQFSEDIDVTRGAMGDQSGKLVTSEKHIRKSLHHRTVASGRFFEDIPSSVTGRLRWYLKRVVRWNIRKLKYIRNSLQSPTKLPPVERSLDAIPVPESEEVL